MKFKATGVNNVKQITIDKFSPYFFDGNRLDSLFMDVMLSSQEDCDDIIKFMKITKHCFPRVPSSTQQIDEINQQQKLINENYRITARKQAMDIATQKASQLDSDMPDAESLLAYADKVYAWLTKEL